METKRKSECPICENFRYIIIDDLPYACGKCNPYGKKYKVVNEERCLGCGKVDCGGCPDGTYKTLVKQ